jgi:aminoglycoside 6'-N-acetyltransferase I
MKWFVKQIHSESSDARQRQKWLSLRRELWPQASIAEHQEETERLIKAENRFAVFLCRTRSGPAVGFAEASIRNDYVNGCGLGPVAFLEGIYVQSENRGKGAARELCAAIEIWARSRGCNELASDVELNNLISQKAHVALGFTETERVVFYRKPL